MASTAAPTLLPAVDLDVKQLSQDLSAAVDQVKEIQVLVTSFIDSIVVRKNDETEKEIQIIKSTIKQVHTIRCKLDKLGSKYAKLKLNNIHAVPLGNTGYVCLDPTEEQSGFYKDLHECYTWLKNLDGDTTRALNVLKRKFSADCQEEIKHMRMSEKTLFEIVERVRIDYPHMSFNMSRLSSEQCIEVKISGTLALYIFFSGLTISHSVVKSIDESFILEPSESSEHNVFKKLSDVFISITLDGIQEEPAELLKKLLKYASSYQHLFVSKCKACNKYLSFESGLLDLLPPIWLDIKTNSFYHMSCK